MLDADIPINLAVLKAHAPDVLDDLTVRASEMPGELREAFESKGATVVIEAGAPVYVVV